MEAYAGSSENIEQISEELLAHRCGISDAIFEGSGVVLDSAVRKAHNDFIMSVSRQIT